MLRTWGVVSAAVFKPMGVSKAALLTLELDLRSAKIGYEMRGVEWTTIDMDVGERGLQQGGRVGDPSSNALIYAGCILEGGVKEAGSDKSRSNSLDIQAPGISRRLLLSPEAMVRMVGSIPPLAEEMGWWW